MPHLEQGDALPTFRYDAPYAAQQPIAELYSEVPAVIVFLSNFGHPVTRQIVQNYLMDHEQLSGCRLACVVRSRHESVAQALQGHELPFTMICDAEGALYEHFEIPQETSPLRYASLQAAAILLRAKKEGYNPEKGQPQQLPLTLVVSTEGKILFAHYGKSLTDLPENCAAISTLAAQAVVADQPEEEEKAGCEGYQEPPADDFAMAAPAAPQQEETLSEQAPEEEPPQPEEQSEPDAAAEEETEPETEPEPEPEADPEENPENDKYKAEGFTLESFFSHEPKSLDEK